ncbi:hypothetical protein HK104_000907 [Borealophlyctis nickersoniae]|nr:hypothetical protein HK104_000907 [Borealophlyctis nickersoniae]
MLRRVVLGVVEALKSVNQQMPWFKPTIAGYDLDGNKYLEAPPVALKQIDHVAASDKTRRSIEYADGRTGVQAFDGEVIPVQWQSWLRHTRKDPPTIEELQRDEAQKQLTIQRAMEIERKWQERKLQLEREKLAQLGQGSEQPVPASREPTGQGDTFEPGAWAPKSKARGSG